MTSTTPAHLTDAPLAGLVVATDFEGWSADLVREFETHAFDPYVGSRLLSENARVRVWEIRLAPGERWHTHRHVLDYFWTAVNAGRSRQHTADGTTREVSFDAGETRHFTFAEGEYLLHDIENVGDGDPVFSTVEHLGEPAPRTRNAELSRRGTRCPPRSTSPPGGLSPGHGLVAG